MIRPNKLLIKCAVAEISQKPTELCEIVSWEENVRVLITRYGKPYVMILPYHEIVIDQEDTSLCTISYREFSVKLNNWLKKASTGQFLKITRFKKPYICAVSAV